MLFLKCVLMLRFVLFEFSLLRRKCVYLRKFFHTCFVRELLSFLVQYCSCFPTEAAFLLLNFGTVIQVYLAFLVEMYLP